MKNKWIEEVYNYIPVNIGQVRSQDYSMHECIQEILHFITFKPQSVKKKHLMSSSPISDYRKDLFIPEYLIIHSECIEVISNTNKG